MEGKDAAFALAKNVVNISYDDIPEEVVESTKKSILDTLGVLVAGSGLEPSCRRVVELVKGAGGREESSILVFGDKVPAQMAAFANGAMVHALDYDDVIDDAVVHPTAATLPAALAIAEQVGKVGGKELITAVTLGNDLITRMSLAVTQSPQGAKHVAGWHMNTTFGAYSSAAAAGKLLGLDEDKMADALGIAFMHTGGSFQINYSDGVDITPLYDCFLSMAGVLSALMAQHGITGVKDCLQSKAGVYNLYFRGEYDPSYLTDKLGERFEGINMGFKLWPTCRCTHVYITATLDLIRKHSISPEDITEVIVTVGDWGQNLCLPLEARRKPETGMFAGLSIPFTVAAAIAKGEVNIGTFTLESLKDPATLVVAQKVVPKYDPQFNVPGIPPAIVEIKTKSGEAYSERVDFPYGHPKNPVTIDDLLKKFRDCVSYSAKPIPKEKSDKAIESILNLEEIDDVGQIIQLFT